jgi:hypothetical protein
VLSLLTPHRSRRSTASSRRPAPPSTRPLPVAVLEPLLARLATLPDGDAAALAALHLDVAVALDELIACRALPSRLALRGPVRAGRVSASLVAAWEHATRSTALRRYR